MGSPAATTTSYHACPAKTGKTPHVGGPVISAGTVTVGGLPIATVGDKCICNGPPDAIAAGSPTVTAYGKPVARVGDATTHGGKIVVGNPTVLIS